VRSDLVSELSKTNIENKIDGRCILLYIDCSEGGFIVLTC